MEEEGKDVKMMVSGAEAGEYEGVGLRGSHVNGKEATVAVEGEAGKPIMARTPDQIQNKRKQFIGERETPSVATL